MSHALTKKLILLLLTAYVSVNALSATEGWTIESVVLPGDVIQGKTILNVLPHVDIDEDGNVAFMADYTDTAFPLPEAPGRGIFTQDRVIVVIGDQIEGVTITDIEGTLRNRPSIANNTVVYVATTPPNFTTLGVFKEQAWVVKPGDVVDPAGDIVNRPFCCAASINNAGTVAFNAGASNTPVTNPFGGNSLDQAIYTSPGGAIVRKYQTYEGFALTQVRETAISNSGNVATSVSIDNPFGTGSRGAVMLNDSFVLKTGDPIVDSGFFYRGTSSTVSINDFDQIAFIGLKSSVPGEGGPWAVLTLDRIVITQNDAVEDLTVRGVISPEINNHNEVAFVASTGDAFPLAPVVVIDDKLIVVPGDTSSGGISLSEIGVGAIGFNNNREIAFTASFGIAGESGGSGLFVTRPEGNEIDPVLATEELIVDFVDLVDSQATNMSHGESKSLLNKLENALKLIAKGNIDDALNQLHTFVRRVGKLVLTGNLSAEQGDDLIAAANAIIDALSP